MRRDVRRGAAPFVVLLFATVFGLGACTGTTPTVDATSASTTAASTTTTAAATTTEPTTTTTAKKRFFSTTTDPDAPTSTKKTSTTKKATTTTKKSSSTTEGSSSEYPPAAKKAFIDSCTDESKGQADLCACVWDQIESTITYERFLEIDKAIGNGEAADSFPEITDAIKACQ
jgi:hypothetical protein